MKWRCARHTWRRDLQVGGLLDVSPSWSGVKGWNQSRELSLQNKIVVPGPPAASLGFVLLLLLEQRIQTLIAMSDFTSC